MQGDVMKAMVLANPAPVEGELPPHKPQIVPGHQVAGVVDAAGPDAGRFRAGDRAGDRVGIAWLRETCGTCRYCVRGDEHLCPRGTFHRLRRERRVRGVCRRQGRFRVRAAGRD
jgi:D-arabinose 1-dehydrogenase-like Zn-dependent alcohol dehydrogenase